jgi:pSer/pThr/pTyr-binding forkhead associated (FHA) protein
MDETTTVLTPVPEAEEELAEIEPQAHGERVLVVKKGPNLGLRYPLKQEKIVLGRDPQSDIFLNDITVSRKHAEIKITALEAKVTDLGSLNGTYVNDSRVEKSKLQNGDILQIGKFKLVYLAPES